MQGTCKSSLPVMDGEYYCVETVISFNLSNIVARKNIQDHAW
jgi:hypothetical protein